jgi:DNA-binding protein H-NS
MTWTGRGKQPAWVRGWLEQGKALDDLLAEKASMSV